MQISAAGQVSRGDRNGCEPQARPPHGSFSPLQARLTSRSLCKASSFPIAVCLGLTCGWQEAPWCTARGTQPSWAVCLYGALRKCPFFLMTALPTCPSLSFSAGCSHVTSLSLPHTLLSLVTFEPLAGGLSTDHLSFGVTVELDRLQKVIPGVFDNQLRDLVSCINFTGRRRGSCPVCLLRAVVSSV